MSGSSVLTLRLDSKLKKQLDRLSEATNRSRSFVAAEAIREYVELNNWQIAETIKGLAEADRGEFATDKGMAQTFRKWTRRAR
jgi:RHH-type transcriptional regulator, rel operon repressor / antitoxin RelB